MLEGEEALESSGDEAVLASGDEAEADNEVGGSQKKKRGRRRRTANDLNLVSDPTDVVVELTEPVLQELSGSRKVHQLRYPTYIVLTHPNFKLRSVEGLQAVKGTALKELDLSHNKLIALDNLEQFSTLKTLRASHNLIAEVTIEKLPRLKLLDLSHNKLSGIPDLSGLKALVHLDLSSNEVGTRPDSETSRDGWELFKNAPLQQLGTLDLSNNELNWSQQVFNDQIAHMKEKRLRHVSFMGNPFVEEVEGYRIWIISNNMRVVDVDGEKVTPLERRSRIKDAPAVLKEAKEEKEEDLEYFGKKITVKLFEVSAKLMNCFDKPDTTIEVVDMIQDDLLRLIPLDPRGRIMFDFKVEDTRDELQLLEDLEKEEDEKRSEHGTDYRPPEELIEEFIQTLVLLVERQAAAAPKVLRLMVLCLSLQNEGLAQRALSQLLDFLEAGSSIGEVVVSTLMSTLIPQLVDAKIPAAFRDLLLDALHTLAEEGEGVKQAMRPLAPTLAQWLNEKEPSEAVLGVIASASRDVKTALELRDERVPRRAIALLQERETKHWARTRRLQLLRVVEFLARNDERACVEFSKAQVHAELLNEVGGAVSVPGQFSDAKSTWVAQLVLTLDALSCNSEMARESLLKSGFVDRLLRTVSSQLNIRAGLLTACLNSLGTILTDCDQLMLKKITYGLGGVVPLLQFISGRKYEQLAELCGEIDENGVVPLMMLRNQQMMRAIGSVIAIIKVYSIRANAGDSEAMDLSNKLDAAGREQVLFSALEVPDDDLKVTVMECLLEVPISNLQAQEVTNIVSIAADCDNLTVGRTEEILGHVFNILR